MFGPKLKCSANIAREKRVPELCQFEHFTHPPPSSPCDRIPKSATAIAIVSRRKEALLCSSHFSALISCGPGNSRLSECTCLLAGLNREGLSRAHTLGLLAFVSHTRPDSDAPFFGESQSFS